MFENLLFYSLSPAFVGSLKRNSELTGDKYEADLFYVAPMFHGAFTLLQRLIVLDMTDLEFFGDIQLLHKQFKNMKHQLIGVWFNADVNLYKT